MRSLSSPTSTATAQPITQPGCLVQFDFSTTLRYSTRGTKNWGGFTWLANNVQVGQLQEMPNGSVSLAIAVGNADLAFGKACLAEAPQEKAVTVWKFYEGALADADPVKLFAGVIDECAIGEQAVQLQLTNANAATLFLPRRRITRASGFNHLVPAGRIVEFGGQRYELTRGFN